MENTDNIHWTQVIGNNLIKEIQINIGGTLLEKPKSQMLKDLETEGYILQPEGFYYVGMTKSLEKMIGTK